MKKLMALLLVLAMVFSFAACGSEKAPEAPEAPSFENAEAVLAEILKNYPEDKMFPMVGGFGEVPVDGAPGAFPIEDAGVVESMLSIPETALEKIDSAANLMNMMNANMFTASASHLKDASAMEGFVEEVKENILAKQWLCGRPEKLIIATVGDYAIVTYGAGEIIDTVKEQITTNIPAAVISVDEAIAE